MCSNWTEILLRSQHQLICNNYSVFCVQQRRVAIHENWFPFEFIGQTRVHIVYRFIQSIKRNNYRTANSFEISKWNCEIAARNKFAGAKGTENRMKVIKKQLWFVQIVWSQPISIQVHRSLYRTASWDQRKKCAFGTWALWPHGGSVCKYVVGVVFFYRHGDNFVEHSQSSRLSRTSRRRKEEQREQQK